MRKSSTRPTTGLDEENNENDCESTNTQLMAELKEQVERAEQASEQYRRQLQALQQRLDEATDQHTAAEERDFAARTQIDKLLAEAKDNARQKRDMEVNFESERSMLMQEKGRTSEREAALQAVVNRLTETLKTKSLERASIARDDHSSSEDTQASTQDSANHQDFRQMLMNDDAMIEALKLELADLHIKIAEQEHMGDGRLQVLEKRLSDIKMQNARLVEENDSFQMLLSEKTLKGNFLQDTSSDSGGISSLAEELESIGENDEVSVEQYRKVEADLKTIKEEKKALTLYIDKIIGRLLQHEGFEHIITGKDADDDAPIPAPPPKPAAKEKPLPLAPAAPISDAASPPGPDTPTVMGGFLSRAKSVVARGPAARPARPMSFMQALPSANENPDTAPRIPLNKGHRRARSDQANTPELAPVAEAQPTNQGSPLRTASGGSMIRGISPLPRAQTAYFSPASRIETVKAPSQAGTAEPSSSRNSVVSGESLGRQSTEATSAQPSVHTSEHRPSMGPPVTAGVMKQSQLRPLRLVQNQDAEEEARKKANRQSWMGTWFSKSSLEANQG